MHNHKAKRFLIPILSLVIISIIFISILNSYMNINMFQKHIENDIAKHKEEYLQKQKDKVYRQVHLVNNAIKFNISKMENKLEKTLTERIQTSLNIANYVYSKQKGRISDDEIRNRISEHLSAIVFPQSSAYYYVIDYDTNILIAHPDKKYLSVDLSPLTDKNGQSIMKLQKQALEKSEIGFVKLHFNKLDIYNKNPELVCVTKFEPLNMLIGTGEHLDVIKKQIQDFILERFKNIEFQENYIFMLNLHNIDGGENFATMIFNPNRKDLIDKKLNDNYKDAKGQEFRKKFLKDIREKGESYTKYWYKKPNMKTPKPKMSYFYLQKDWNWIIASGFYFDDLNKQISNMKKSIEIYRSQAIIDSIFWIFILSCIIMIVAIYISFRIDKTIKIYTDELRLNAIELEKSNDKIEKINKNLQTEIDKEVEKNKTQQLLMVQQSRLAQMGEMISMIAHQWRQPLNAISTTSINLNVKAQLGRLNPEFVSKQTDKICKYTEHLSTTIEDFRNFFKPNKQKKEVTFDELIDSVLDIVEVSIINKNIKLIRNRCLQKRFETYPNELRQVILNLIKNAEDVLLEKNIENPFIKITTFKDKNSSILEIADNGKGVPDKIISKIFDPYFSTKKQKNGTGLGLYMSKTIIEGHCGGKLTVSNNSQGAVFKITL